MNDKPSFSPYLFATILMILGGWGGLIFLLNYTLPELWPRWGFFALLVIACTGTALPFTWFLNRQLLSTPPDELKVFLRQAIWVGLYGATLGWLQMGHVLTFTLGFSLACTLIVIEYLLRLRESAVAKPADQQPSQATGDRESPKS